jgi:xylan 1,4-beta-xylosidase
LGLAVDGHHHRVDDHRSNVAAVWGRLRDGDQDWPTDEPRAQLRAADRLEQLGEAQTITADGDGRLEVTFDLPMPAMSSLHVRRPGLA